MEHSNDPSRAGSDLRSPAEYALPLSKVRVSILVVALLVAFISHQVIILFIMSVLDEKKSWFSVNVFNSPLNLSLACFLSVLVSFLSESFIKRIYLFFILSPPLAASLAFIMIHFFGGSNESWFQAGAFFSLFFYIINPLLMGVVLSQMKITKFVISSGNFLLIFVLSIFVANIVKDYIESHHKIIASTVIMIVEMVILIFLFRILKKTPIYFNVHFLYCKLFYEDLRYCLNLEERYYDVSGMVRRSKDRFKYLSTLFGPIAWFGICETVQAAILLGLEERFDMKSDFFPNINTATNIFAAILLPGMHFVLIPILERFKLLITDLQKFGFCWVLLFFSIFYCAIFQLINVEKDELPVSDYDQIRIVNILDSDSKVVIEYSTITIKPQTIFTATKLVPNEKRYMTVHNDDHNIHEKISIFTEQKHSTVYVIGEKGLAHTSLDSLPSLTELKGTKNPFLFVLSLSNISQMTLKGDQNETKEFKDFKSARTELKKGNYEVEIKKGNMTTSLTQHFDTVNLFIFFVYEKDGALKVIVENEGMKKKFIFAWLLPAAIAFGVADSLSIHTFFMFTLRQCPPFLYSSFISLCLLLGRGSVIVYLLFISVFYEDGFGAVYILFFLLFHIAFGVLFLYVAIKYKYYDYSNLNMSETSRWSYSKDSLEAERGSS